jgi:hypothetical protein
VVNLIRPELVKASRFSMALITTNHHTILQDNPKIPLKPGKKQKHLHRLMCKCLIINSITNNLHPGAFLSLLYMGR